MKLYWTQPGPFGVARRNEAAQREAGSLARHDSRDAVRRRLRRTFQNVMTPPNGGEEPSQEGDPALSGDQSSWLQERVWSKRPMTAGARRVRKTTWIGPSGLVRRGNPAEGSIREMLPRAPGAVGTGLDSIFIYPWIDKPMLRHRSGDALHQEDLWVYEFLLRSGQSELGVDPSRPKGVPQRDRRIAHRPAGLGDWPHEQQPGRRLGGHRRRPTACGPGGELGPPWGERRRMPSPGRRREYGRSGKPRACRESRRHPGAF